MQNRLQYLVAMSHHQDTYHLDMVENHHCIIAVLAVGLLLEY
jgi:hypothetical protein